MMLNCPVKVLCLLLSFINLLNSVASGRDSKNQQIMMVRDQPVIILLPSPFDSSKSYPLLIALHGNGGTPGPIAELFGHYRDKSLITGVPHGQYSAAYGTGYSWFFETMDRSLWEQADSVSVGHIMTIISNIGKKYRIGKVHVFGFSQGASLAYMTGLKNPDRISGIIAVGGFMPDIGQPGSLIKSDDIRKSSGVPLLIAHGNRDIIANKSQFLSQIQYFRIQGYPVTEYEFDAGHTLTYELLDYVVEWILASR